MSITTELQRITQAKADLKTAIESKGVTIDETAKLDTYASKVEEISSGGGSAPETIVLATAFDTSLDGIKTFLKLFSTDERGAFFTLETSAIDPMPSNQCLAFWVYRSDAGLSAFRKNSTLNSSSGLTNAYVSGSMSLIGNVGDVYIKEVFK